MAVAVSKTRIYLFTSKFTVNLEHWFIYVYSYILLWYLYAAPGTYSPEKVNLDKGPQYSLAGKGVPEKLNNNPGESTSSR